MNRAYFSIGGARFEFHSAWSPILFPDAYRPFIAQGGPADASLEILSADAVIASNGPVVFESPTWQLATSRGGGYTVSLRTVDDRLVTTAEAAPDFSSGAIVPRVGRHAAIAPYALNYPTDQVLFVNRLALLRAGILHACGIAIDGKAWLFSGPSGAGKTTLARLWRGSGAILLNDDRMCVRLRDDELVAAATPWHGDEKEVHADVLPLGGVAFIEHGSENAIERLSAAESLARLMANAVAPFYMRSAIEKLAALWAGVVDSVPVCRLRFTPDERALATCRRWLEQEAGKPTR